MALVALLGCVFAAYWAGIRAQRYRQARADWRDTKGKLGKARAARATRRTAALVGWLTFGGVAVLAGVTLFAGAR